MFEEHKRLEEKDLENQQKVFKKYMTFYYFRKNREREQKLKHSQSVHKLMEKSEKLEEIEKMQNKKKKDLMIKMDTMEKKKREVLKHKSDNFNKFKIKRDKYNMTCKLKQQNMMKELSNFRLDVLDYQSCILKREQEKTKLVTLRRNQSTERTLNDQLNFLKNIGTYFKKLEAIKSENVMRKSVQDRRKIYLRNKREKEERKKREEENL